MDKVLYDKNGDVVEDENLACAKHTRADIQENGLGKGRVIDTYYVKYSDYLYDPVNMSEVDIRYRNWKLKPVAKKVFDIYLQFLKTKKEFYRLNAERLINAT